MQPFIIAFFVATVDTLYYTVFGKILQVLPDRHGGGPWGRALISGVAGVAGAFAIMRLTGQVDIFTVVVGAVIGGRLVGGAIASTAPAPHQ
jgi:hypothetical protein